MSELDWLELEKLAITWVKDAGRQLKSSLLEIIIVESKSNPDDLVTEMDRRIEKFFLHKIKETFPSHSFLGEEGGGEKVDSTDGTLWIIDPIDGTTNFVHQQFNFAISLAVYHNGEGMIGITYNVMGDELFHAVKGHGAYLNDLRLPEIADVKANKAIIGLNARWLLVKDKRISEPLGKICNSVRSIRSYGSAAIEIAYVAAGRLDSYISMQLSPWDFAAGMVLLREVNGECKTFDGEDLDLLMTSSVFVGKQFLIDEIINHVIKGD
jgi:myo-inositol-1(or 4)-monophosphatase